jgi:transposase-like protein
MDNDEAPAAQPESPIEFPKSIQPPTRKFGNRYTVAYPKELKDAAIAQVLAGKTTREVADELKIDISNVGRWVRESGHGGRSNAQAQKPPQKPPQKPQKAVPDPVEEEVELTSPEELQLAQELVKVNVEIDMLKQLLKEYLN